jgi:hypothetical protein
MFYNFLSIQYQLGKLSDEQIDSAVVKGLITAEQAAEIKAESEV